VNEKGYWREVEELGKKCKYRQGHRARIEMEEIGAEAMQEANKPSSDQKLSRNISENKDSRGGRNKRANCEDDHFNGRENKGRGKGAEDWRLPELFIAIGEIQGLQGRNPTENWLESGFWASGPRNKEYLTGAAP